MERATMTPRSLLAAAAVLSLFNACTAGRAACGPDTCTTGCCDANGICVAGNTAAACGGAGNACVACGSNEACNAATCVPVQPVGGADAGHEACAATPVACETEAADKLYLLDSVNPDGITNVADGAGWISTINASAGGMNVTKAYVYAIFTPEGLAQMPFSDLEALSNAQWDIGFRRFVIRLNGGDSGPSCVSAAIAGSSTYDSVTAASDTGVAEMDGFLDASCAFVADGSGLNTSPKTAMSGFYAYAGCVKMTGAVYVLSLADGRKVKAEVLGYYQADATQQACQSGNPQMGTGGYIKLRWAFL
jgi:hypothetical protein